MVKLLVPPGPGRNRPNSFDFRLRATTVARTGVEGTRAVRFFEVDVGLQSCSGKSQESCTLDLNQAVTNVASIKVRQLGEAAWPILPLHRGDH